MTITRGLAAVIDSPIGKLGIELDQQYLVGLHFMPKELIVAKPTSPLASEVKRQLDAYFKKELVSFDLPLRLSGSDFQKSFLSYLNTVPYGKTLTYGEVAGTLTTAARAVGNACRRNPIPIIIPCHRIVARNHLGGYSGAVSGHLLSMKKWLLQHEGSSYFQG